MYVLVCLFISLFLSFSLSMFLSFLFPIFKYFWGKLSPLLIFLNFPPKKFKPKPQKFSHQFIIPKIFTIAFPNRNLISPIFNYSKNFPKKPIETTNPVNLIKSIKPNFQKIPRTISNKILFNLWKVFFFWIFLNKWIKQYSRVYYSIFSFFQLEKFSVIFLQKIFQIESDLIISWEEDWVGNVEKSR